MPFHLLAHVRTIMILQLWRQSSEKFMQKFRSHSFSHILFSINSKTGHSGLPGESLQGSFSQMTGWPSVYMHWECSVCLLDCHWVGLHLPRKEGTWKAHSSSLNGLVMLVHLRTRILAPALICTASLSGLSKSGMSPDYTQKVT